MALRGHFVFFCDLVKRLLPWKFVLFSAFKYNLEVPYRWGLSYMLDGIWGKGGGFLRHRRGLTRLFQKRAITRAPNSAKKIGLCKKIEFVNWLFELELWLLLYENSCLIRVVKAFITERRQDDKLTICDSIAEIILISNFLINYFSLCWILLKRASSTSVISQSAICWCMYAHTNR